MEEGLEAEQIASRLIAEGIIAHPDVIRGRLGCDLDKILGPQSWDRQTWNWRPKVLSFDPSSLEEYSSFTEGSSEQMDPGLQFWDYLTWDSSLPIVLDLSSPEEDPSFPEETILFRGDA